MRRLLSAAPTALAGLLLLAACGTDSPPDDLAFASDIEPVELSEEEQVLVEIQADWMCDAQRYAFNDPAEIIEARAEKLAANDVTDEEYAAFEASLPSRLDLRDAVFLEFSARCATGSGG